MNDRNQIVEQVGLAFDFIQKLYLETSYLIKEIEGILHEEEEQFVIGKPSGYAVSTRSSSGLESNNVALWLNRKFAVCFIPANKTEVKGGQTITKFTDDLRVLYLRILLQDKSISEPAVYSGVLFDIAKKPHAEHITKFERFMSHIS